MRRRTGAATTFSGLAALGVALLACPAPLPTAEGLRFGCTADGDCPEGEHCVGGLCALGRADAGASDTLVADQRGVDASRTDLLDSEAHTDTRARDRHAADSSDAAATDAATTDATADDGSGLDTAATDGSGGDAAVEDGGAGDVTVDGAAPLDAAALDATQEDAAAGADAGVQVLYEQRFDDADALSAFDRNDGDWSISSGALQQTDACIDALEAAPNVAVSGQSWGDVVASVKVRFDQDCDDLISGKHRAALLVRVEGIRSCVGDAYYACMIDRTNARLYAGKWVNSCSPLSYAFIATEAPALGAWNTLTASMIGTTLRCQLRPDDDSGTTTVEYTDPSPWPHTSGSVGLATWETAASFDDLIVARP